MKIVNKTGIRTDDIRRLVRAVALKELFTPEQISLLRVRVRHRRRSHARNDRHAGGWAYYHSTGFELTFVKGVQPDPVATAKTIAHELAHCQGVKHRNMRNTLYGWKPGWEETWAWAKDYPLTLKPEPTKPTAEETASEDIERCRKAIDAWQRKAKLAATKLRRWKTKLHYYERKAAAMTAQEPPSENAVAPASCRDQGGETPPEASLDAETPAAPSSH